MVLLPVTEAKWHSSVAHDISDRQGAAFSALSLRFAREAALIFNRGKIDDDGH
jgi:hypothetical protein